MRSFCDVVKWDKNPNDRDPYMCTCIDKYQIDIYESFYNIYLYI